MDRLNKNRTGFADFSYVCFRWSALRKGQGNVANTYQLIGLCYVLLIVSGKKRHIKETGINRR